MDSGYPFSLSLSNPLQYNASEKLENWCFQYAVVSMWPTPQTCEKKVLWSITLNFLAIMKKAMCGTKAFPSPNPHSKAWWWRHHGVYNVSQQQGPENWSGLMEKLMGLNREILEGNLFQSAWDLRVGFASNLPCKILTFEGWIIMHPPGFYLFVLLIVCVKMKNILYLLSHKHVV